MKHIISVLILSFSLSLQAKSIHCSDNEDILDYLHVDVDDVTRVGKVELKSRKVNQLPNTLLGVSAGSLGYIGLLTVDTPNVTCFFSKFEPEPLSCSTGGNGAGNGKFTQIMAEGDTDLEVQDIDHLYVTIAKTTHATASGSDVGFVAGITISKYNDKGPNPTFRSDLRFRNCKVVP